jgi:hypothetical protein
LQINFSLLSHNFGLKFLYFFNTSYIFEISTLIGFCLLTWLFFSISKIAITNLTKTHLTSHNIATHFFFFLIIFVIFNYLLFSFTFILNYFYWERFYIHLNSSSIAPNFLNIFLILIIAYRFFQIMILIIIKSPFYLPMILWAITEKFHFNFRTITPHILFLFLSFLSLISIQSMVTIKSFSFSTLYVQNWFPTPSLNLSIFSLKWLPLLNFPTWISNYAVPSLWSETKLPPLTTCSNWLLTLLLYNFHYTTVTQSNIDIFSLSLSPISFTLILYFSIILFRR